MGAEGPTIHSNVCQYFGIGLVSLHIYSSRPEKPRSRWSVLTSIVPCPIARKYCASGYVDHGVVHIHGTCRDMQALRGLVNLTLTVFYGGSFVQARTMAADDHNLFTLYSVVSVDRGALNCCGEVRNNTFNQRKDIGRP